jgi:hypothetical protein
MEKAIRPKTTNKIPGKKNQIAFRIAENLFKKVEGVLFSTGRVLGYKNNFFC